MISAILLFGRKNVSFRFGTERNAKRIFPAFFITKKLSTLSWKPKNQNKRKNKRIAWMPAKRDTMKAPKNLNAPK